MASSPPETRPPNIALILLDDLGYGDLESYRAGSQLETFIRTPHLDRLAGSGLRFTQYYASAPVCSPTRVSILTGRYPQRYNIRGALAVGRPWSHRRISHRGLPADAFTLPKMLKSMGYDTYHVGKWHVGAWTVEPDYRPTAAGFDDFLAVVPEERGRGYCEETVELADGTRLSTTDGITPPHLTELLTGRAAAYVEQRPADAPPFFLNLWLRAPHAPWRPPIGCQQPWPDDYVGLVENADARLGELFDVLFELPHTLILLASDNGPEALAIDRFDSALGLAGGKGELRDAGIRAPLLARWQGEPGQPVIAPGGVTDYPAASLDLLTTLARVVGYGGDTRTDGESFHDILLDPVANDRPRRTLLVWETKRRPRGSLPPAEPEVDAAIRDDRWKLALRRGRVRELYDMNAPDCSPPGPLDRCEVADVDLSERPDFAATVQRLAAEYRAWRWRVSELVEYAVDRVEGDVQAADGVLTFLDCPSCSGWVRLTRDELAGEGDSWVVSLEVQPGTWAAGRRACLASQGGAWRLRLRASGRLQLRLRAADGGKVDLESEAPMAIGAWNRLTFVVDPGTAQARLWLNDAPPVLAPELPALAASTKAISVGAQKDADGRLVDPFRGRIRRLAPRRPDWLGAVRFHPVPWLPATALGDEMAFDGDGGLIRLPRHPLHDFHDGDFTFSIEVRPDPRGAGGFASLAGRAGSWRLALRGDGRVRLKLTGQRVSEPAAATTVLDSPAPLVAGAWTRVTFVVSSGPAGNCPCAPDLDPSCDESDPFQRCQTVRLYVAGQAPVSSREIPDVAPSRSRLILGGQESGGVLIHPFRGELRGLRLFVTALGGAEVEELSAA